MKYIKLFEELTYDILDLYLMDVGEVKELFFKELNKETIDLENIQVFLDSGLVDVHTKDADGRTPLHWAAMWNSLAVAELLISSGADLEARDADGRTPLHRAAWNNSLAVAQLLISSGADLEAKDNRGWTPLALATLNGHRKMKELLKKHGGTE